MYVVSYIKAPLYQGHKWKLYNWFKANFEILNKIISFGDNFLNAYSTDALFLTCERNSSKHALSAYNR